MVSNMKTKSVLFIIAVFCATSFALPIEIEEIEDATAVPLLNVEYEDDSEVVTMLPEDELVAATIQPLVEEELFEDEKEEEIMEPRVEPDVEPIVEPVVEAVIEPVVEPVVEPVLKSVVEPAVE